MFVIKPRFSYSKTIYFLRVTCHTKDSKIRNLWHSKEKATQIVTSIELLHSNCSEWQRLHRLVGIVSAPFASVVILLAAFLVKSGWRMTFPPSFFKRAFRLEAADRNVGKKKNQSPEIFISWRLLNCSSYETQNLHPETHLRQQRPNHDAIVSSSASEQLPNSALIFEIWFAIFLTWRSFSACRIEIRRCYSWSSSFLLLSSWFLFNLFICCWFVLLTSLYNRDASEVQDIFNTKKCIIYYYGTVLNSTKLD